MYKKISWQKKVLVVEDDELYCHHLRSYLEQNGITAKPAWSIDEAIHLLKEEEPDAVILDLILPETNRPSSKFSVRGAEIILRYINEVYGENSIKVFIISSTLTDNLRNRFNKMGAAKVIEKPFAPELLLKGVREASFAPSKGKRRVKR